MKVSDLVETVWWPGHLNHGDVGIIIEPFADSGIMVTGKTWVVLYFSGVMRGVPERRLRIINENR